MAVPTFLWVQFTSAYSSGAATEFSNTGGVGAALASLTGTMNFSNSNLATGAQSSNVWSAAHPVAQGTISYEFIFGLYVKTVADNSITNMRMWAVPFTPITGVTFKMGTVGGSAFSAPVATTSAKAITNFTALNDVNSAYLFVNSPANRVGGLSDPVYFQAQTSGAAVGGNQAGMPTIGVSIDFS